MKSAIKAKPRRMSDDEQREVEAVLASLPRTADQMLCVLHAIQDRLGFVPSDALPMIGKALNVSRAEVYGIVTFYPHFRMDPPGRHTVRVCRAEACQAMGAEALLSHASRTLGVAPHETTTSGAFTLEPVHCLGNCACSPAVMIDDDIHGRVTTARFDALVHALEGSA